MARTDIRSRTTAIRMHAWSEQTRHGSVSILSLYHDIARSHMFRLSIQIGISRLHYLANLDFEVRSGNCHEYAQIRFLTGCGQTPRARNRGVLQEPSHSMGKE